MSLYSQSDKKEWLLDFLSEKSYGIKEENIHHIHGKIREELNSKQIHNMLDEFRVNPNREFFKYPLHKAIELIQKLNKNDDINVFESIEISSSLLARYGNSIEESISSMRICQNNERVYFEFTKNEYIADY